MTAAVGGERVWYLYGVVPGGQPLPASAVASKNVTPLEAIPFSTLVAVVESVPASEFSPETLEQRLQSIDWVGPLARKHTAVLEEAMQHGPVVPARLCTLFSSAEALTNSLAENERRFQDALGWLRGRQEWGCKIFCNEEVLRSTAASIDPAVQALEAAATAASQGQAYVLRKKRDGCLAEVASVRIDEVLEEILDALASVTVDIRLRPTISEAATGRRETMVTNAAVLIDIAAAGALHATTTELVSRRHAEGFALELSGPWPPYSFCDDDPVDSESASEQAR